MGIAQPSNAGCRRTNWTRTAAELPRGLGSDVALVVGSRILNDPEGIPTALRAFHCTMRELGPSSA